ncbi:hypothetical protein HW450_02490 [Corynebacterium hindlerae]|uniref:Secreted protein n=1 Tax=Corynebacterium hindlerae TaxID=699041 RepID=A0A7G5FG95_9CORY|nr:hypothetical protein [Corynebacterium hindlerae]QMV85636.1 hypothetical protein HW450_02490 [Corynebacterium hindlerae]
MIRRGVAAVSCMIIAGALVWAQFTDHSTPPRNNNGDVVGMETGETFPEYHSRAQATVDSATGDCFALVTLERPGDLAPLDAISVQRLSAAVYRDKPAVPVPEPIGGATRSSVLPAPESVVAVVVYSAAEQLRDVAKAPGIAVVEALPDDAAWGQFGIRPVAVE